jgi:hypothetical protein
MGETSAASSPLAGNKSRTSRKSRTTNTKTMTMKALEIVMLGHKRIGLFKINIEGYEWPIKRRT